MFLYDELRKYCGSDNYPFHMPGHKRRLGEMADPFCYDITEIEGFDNLHHAEGILLEAQQRAAGFYGTEETFFLVNGSTCGILSAISACAGQGKILMARNCHKAAYHAVYLNRLDCTYLTPHYFRDAKGTVHPEINGPVDPMQVREVLERDPEIKAVFLTSPTYEGVVSDIRTIAEIAHEHGVPLIVDEAHGAHFSMHRELPVSAVTCGADLIIQSLHKTLPSLTQTAVLHVQGKLVDRGALRRYLGIYQTSSPSYVLMASMDQCIRMLQENGQQLFEIYMNNLKQFYCKTAELKYLVLIRTDDPGKILISGENCGLSGMQISDILRKRAGIEPEMECGSYVLALSSVGDSEEGFERLAEAVCMLDRSIAEMHEPSKTGEAEKKIVIRDAAQQERSVSIRDAAQQEICMNIWNAMQQETEQVPLEKSRGRISGEYLYLYPPGIPMVVPGERIGEKLLDQVYILKKMGYRLQGMEDYSMAQIRVLKKG